VKTDYANAGVPMLPVVAGERTTRRQIGLYTIPMALAALLPNARVVFSVRDPADGFWAKHIAKVCGGEG
jgi:heme O synthase-like polyprenyltransferase